MYVHTVSSYNSRNTARGRIAAIPEKEQRPRHCIMSTQTKSESPFPLSAPFASSSPLALAAARTLSPLRVTDDDGNNSCLVFPHVSTCVCEPTQRVREVRLRNRHIPRDLHATECAEGRRTTRPRHRFTLDEVYAVAVIKASVVIITQEDAVIIRITSPYLILTVRRRFAICRCPNQLFPH